jgi:ketosteroid isomerase-like protein
MSLQSPRQFDEHFAKAFNANDADAVLALYESGATLIPQPGNPVTGSAALREALGHFLALNGQIDLRTVGVTETSGLALLLTDWTINGGTDVDGNPVELGGRSTNVLRQQSDGTWLAVIDDPWSAG